MHHLSFSNFAAGIKVQGAQTLKHVSSSDGVTMCNEWIMYNIRYDQTQTTVSVFKRMCINIIIQNNGSKALSYVQRLQHRCFATRAPAAPALAAEAMVASRSKSSSDRGWDSSPAPLLAGTHICDGSNRGRHSEIAAIYADLTAMLSSWEQKAPFAQ